MVAVDVTGARLIEAAAAGADLVSPNLVEAEQALDADGTSRSPDGTGEVVDLDDLDGAVVAARSRTAAASLVDVGARCAMVSAGRHGVACRSEDLDVFVPAPSVTVANPIGAGDALLGATLVALERGRSLEAAVGDGVAYAAASVAHPVAGYADPSVVDEPPRPPQPASNPEPPVSADAPPTRRAPTVSDVAGRAGVSPRPCRAPSTTRATCVPTRSTGSAAPPRSWAFAPTSSPASCEPGHDFDGRSRRRASAIRSGPECCRASNR